MLASKAKYTLYNKSKLYSPVSLRIKINFYSIFECLVGKSLCLYSTTAIKTKEATELGPLLECSSYKGSFGQPTPQTHPHLLAPGEVSIHIKVSWIPYVLIWKFWGFRSWDDLRARQLLMTYNTGYKYNWVTLQ